MDEHKEKEEDKFQESSEQQQPLKQEAAEEEEVKSKEAMDQQRQEGYKEGRIAEEEPTVQVQLKEVETTSSEEASSPFGGIFAYPCSLLQYLLRAFFGWFWPALHGAFGDDGKKPQQAAAAVAPEAAAPVNSTEQGGGDDEKADNCFYMEEEVVTRVWAVRRGRPPQGAPGHPREGRGGNGGVHH